MWCAGCGQPLAQFHHGAYAECCGGVGYWSRVQPLPADLWYPVTQRRGVYFYPSAKWNSKRSPVFPLELE